jgi:carbonic anhydrase
LVLEVQHIVVCGHSECGAIRAAVTGQVPPSCAHLSHWVQQLKEGRDISEEKLTPGLSHLNLVSQASVLRQIDNLKSSPLVESWLSKGKLTLHGWWFDIGNLDVYCFNESKQKYELMDEAVLAQMLAPGQTR